MGSKSLNLCLCMPSLCHMKAQSQNNRKEWNDRARGERPGIPTNKSRVISGQGKVSALHMDILSEDPTMSSLYCTHQSLGLLEITHLLDGDTLGGREVESLLSHDVPVFLCIT